MRCRSRLRDKAGLVRVTAVETMAKTRHIVWWQWTRGVFFAVYSVFILLAAILGGCEARDSRQPQVAALQEKVIFGDDNRIDLSDDATFDKFASAVAAVVPYPSIAGCTDHKCDLHTVPYGEVELVCPDERFYGEPTAAICTAFLVSSNVIATAGHCVADQQACEQLAFVFGFARESAQGPFKTTGLESYSCAKLLARADADDDYALIQLDRTAHGHAVLPLKSSDPVYDTEVFVMGHPSGLPMKVATDGALRGMLNNMVMYNVDSTHGNSGGPLINAMTGEVEGIVVAGPRSNELDTTNMCYRERTCPVEGCDESNPAYGVSGSLMAGATPGKVVYQALANTTVNCDQGTGG